MSNVSSWLGAPRLKIMIAERSSRPIDPAGRLGRKEIGQRKANGAQRADFEKVAPRGSVAGGCAPLAKNVQHGKRLPIDGECLPQ